MSPATASILIVEDDIKTNDLITRYLDHEGFHTIAAFSGAEALILFSRHKPDFIILDLMLPEADGWDVIRQIRKASDVPVLMLTARSDEIDRVSGLRMGADDYVVKPFSPSELVARIRAILRRSCGRNHRQPNNFYSSGSLVLDAEKRKVTLGGRPVSLTSHEYILLSALMRRPGKIFCRAELLDHLYPNARTAVVDRVIDVHIGKLRQKIESDLSSPRYIRTVRGLGYEFIEKGEQPG